MFVWHEGLEPDAHVRRQVSSPQGRVDIIPEGATNEEIDGFLDALAEP